MTPAAIAVAQTSRQAGHQRLKIAEPAERAFVARLTPEEAAALEGAEASVSVHGPPAVTVPPLRRITASHEVANTQEPWHSRRRWRCRFRVRLSGNSSGPAGSLWAWARGSSVATETRCF